MPRVADHDQRRAQIARAFQRLLAAEGLGGTSFVRVAAAAGVSVGLIQHYFANKEQLLQFSYEDGLERIGARIDAHIEAGEAAGQPISRMLLACFMELLPVDEERVIEYRVQQNLLTQALTDPKLADVARQAASELHARVARAIENGKVCGEVLAEVDSETAAAMIVDTAHGVAAAVSLSTAIAADDVLRPVISLVFTGRCRHYDS